MAKISFPFNVPRLPVGDEIDVVAFDQAMRPSELGKSIKNRPQDSLLAKLILSSPGFLGTKTRTILKRSTGSGRLPEHMTRWMLALGQNREDMWAEILNAAGQHCQDPLVAWRLFNAYSTSSTGGDRVKLMSQTTSFSLWKSLDTPGLSDDDFEKAWKMRMGIEAITQQHCWGFLLANMNDERWLARQVSLMDRATIASVAWTVLSDARVPDVNAGRLLRHCDLTDANTPGEHNTLVKEALGIIKRLESGLNDVPDSDIQSFSKHIHSVVKTIDRFIKITGEEPVDPLYTLAKLGIPENLNSRADIPHVVAMDKRSKLSTINDRAVTPVSSPRPKF